MGPHHCPKKTKVATLLLPFLIGPAMVLSRAGDATPTFDTTAGECLETWPLPGISEWVAAGILAAIALALAFRLRVVRSQVRTAVVVVCGRGAKWPLEGERVENGSRTECLHAECEMYGLWCKRKQDNSPTRGDAIKIVLRIGGGLVTASCSEGRRRSSSFFIVQLPATETLAEKIRAIQTCGSV